MSLTRLNTSAATLSKRRTGESFTPISGMCVTCVDGCIGMCEIGKSAYRGSEVIYPQPFGIITAASEKVYPVDLSHFNIMGTVIGAKGISADSDQAIFTNVNLERGIGRDKGIKLRLPAVIAAMGSTMVAKNNWEGLAIGAAISGISLSVGENVCGMDPESEIKGGKIVRSKDMEFRVKTFQEWQEDGYGTVAVQANVEDTKLGVQEYAITRLGVEAVELKWGQGAKDIGGEVKIKDLARAQLLKKRGYIVLPDPEDPAVIEAYNAGTFTEFERHSRVGMVNLEDFVERVEELRKVGAKHVFLKTGAYRPSDLARALKFSSEAKIDLLTVDAAGGGTGMSPWRMMNEWGVPGVELWSLLYQYAHQLARKGSYVPDLAIAGGITFEDQIFKVLALGAPYFKAVAMSRAPMAAAMVGKNIGKRIKEGMVPVYVERFGNTIDEIFITATELKEKYGKDFDRIPPGAIGLYTYFKRIEQGMRQMMAGARTFSLDYISRNDIAALTREAAEISGISYIMDLDKEEAEQILSS